ncbi:MAG: sialidase family protein [Terriglobia bacterium]
MQNRRNQVGGIFFSLVAGLVLSTLVSNAQQTANSVPLDRGAVFKTHVPHENANLWRSQSGSSTTSNGAGPSAKPGGGGGGGGGGGTFTGTPYATVGAVKNATSTVPGAEEHIAVDPTSANNLVAAISDFSQRGGYNTTKYAWSYDGGGTWAEHFVQYSGSLLQTGDSLSWEANSDPVVAIDKGGRVFLADLYFNASNNAGGLYVGVGSLGASNLGISAGTTYPVAVQTDPNTSTFEDKEWLAVDNSGGARDGNVYVTWTRFTSTADMVLFSRSTDHGQTWSAPVQVSNPSFNGAVQGSQIAVGPDGTIYVVYEVFYVGNQRAHFLSKSTNGGTSFSSSVQVTPLFGELKFNSTYRKNTFASLAIGSSGAVYVVYADQPKNGGSQIRFVSSTNGGSSFSSPRSVNDSSSGNRLMPSVATDSTGIHFSWFDTRNGAGSSAVYDIYATRSDNGSAFSPNQRLTPSSINAGSASFIGDYGGEAALSGYAHPVWTSGGFNGGKLQTATLH